MMMNLYEAKNRFTGEIVRGYAVRKVEMLGVTVAVLHTSNGEVNCFVESVKEL